MDNHELRSYINGLLADVEAIRDFQDGNWEGFRFTHILDEYLVTNSFSNGTWECTLIEKEREVRQPSLFEWNTEEDQPAKLILVTDDWLRSRLLTSLCDYFTETVNTLDSMVLPDYSTDFEAAAKTLLEKEAIYVCVDADVSLYSEVKLVRRLGGFIVQIENEEWFTIQPWQKLHGYDKAIVTKLHDKLGDTLRWSETPKKIDIAF